MASSSVLHAQSAKRPRTPKTAANRRGAKIWRVGSICSRHQWFDVRFRFRFVLTFSWSPARATRPERRRERPFWIASLRLPGSWRKVTISLSRERAPAIYLDKSPFSSVTRTSAGSHADTCRLRVNAARAGPSAECRASDRSAQADAAPISRSRSRAHSRRRRPPPPFAGRAALRPIACSVPPAHEELGCNRQLGLGQTCSTSLTQPLPPLPTYEQHTDLQAP